MEGDCIFLKVNLAPIQGQEICANDSIRAQILHDMKICSGIKVFSLNSDCKPPHGFSTTCVSISNRCRPTELTRSNTHLLTKFIMEQGNIGSCINKSLNLNAIEAQEYVWA